MAIFTVVGAGMMGSALCVPLVDRGHQVRLVGTHLDHEIIENLRRDHVHPTLKEKLPDAIKPFFIEEIASAMDGAEIVGLGVSSAGVEWAARALSPFASAARPIVMITKGLLWDGSCLRVLPDVLSDSLAHAAPSVHPVAVAGPCIAGELARRVETCVVFAGRDAEATTELASAARTDYYHATTTDDLVGAEVCAALKNAYAMGIAFGIGIHESRGGAPGSVALHNYESAVFAQAIVEMQRLVTLLGGRAETVAGLAGVGDLDVTCNGGRTGRFGRLLGLGLPLAEAIAKMEGATLECLDILRVMRSAAPWLESTLGVKGSDLPLLEHLAAVALDGEPVAMPFDRFFGR